ncbi:unnamed protein product, partial [Vitis vinifera]|uniref:DAGKc domain-containing protein n=1 Tax=Vitis vinifera TaxID=29760 RepID=D7TZ12_VITVI
MEVVKTSSAGHAKELASSVDFSTCPDGIICIGGDGIVNEVSHFAALVIIVVSGCLSSNPLFCIFYKFLSSPHSFPGM